MILHKAFPPTDLPPLLNQWIQISSKPYVSKSEEWYWGDYYYKIDERLYRIELRYRIGQQLNEICCQIITHLNTGENYHIDILKERTDLQDIELSLKLLLKLCDDFVKEKSADIESKIKEIELKKHWISDKEWSELGISKISKDGKYLDWNDIYFCGLEFPKSRFRLLDCFCPHCGEPMIQSYFTTSKESWQLLCGRAGNIFFCPKCQEQFQFELLLMN